MSIIKKIIGLILFIGIIFLLIQARTLVPIIGSMFTGKGSSISTFGSDITTQIMNIYPIQDYGGSSYTPRIISYSEYAGYKTTEGVPTTVVTTGKVTVEKNVQGSLYLSASKVQVRTDKPVYFWLTDTPTITADTRYIEFGQVVPNTDVYTYTVNTGTNDVELSIFKYLMIVDKSYTVYAVAELQK